MNAAFLSAMAFLLSADLPANAVQPALDTAAEARLELGGYLRERIDKTIERYFLVTPESSPAILQVLRDRDKVPVRDPLVLWAGEFAGKFLTGAELVWRVTHDDRLKAAIDAFVSDLVACQGADGYLGPFPASARLTGNNWDVWGHYHCMYGLLLYNEDTGNDQALDACRKAADLLCATFGPGKPSLTCDGSGGQMNMAICHSLVLLFRKTGETRYLDLANYVIHEAWNEATAGHYLESALAGKPVWEFPQHRWEALHDYQALPELYWLTGKDDYRIASERIWRSGLRGDRHNTGGSTSGEGFCGNPYNQGAIETCCTVAWISYGLDLLRMTGDSRIADEIEWSTLNSALGAVPYSGRACTYNVPMDGTRTFGVELPWQSPKAGPNLNCCAVNAYRPLGMLAQWALMRSSDGLVLNYYGPSTLSARLASGNRVVFQESTKYPAEPHVSINLSLDRPEKFVLRLRIPAWSKATTVSVNGQAGKAVPGTYFTFESEWKTGDVIELDLDFNLRFWAGDRECAGKVSVFRGPLLLAFDGRYSELDPNALPKLDWHGMKFEAAAPQGPLPPWVAGMLTSGGGTIPVCDFSSAGQTGNHYRSWLPADNLPPSPFHLVLPDDGAAGNKVAWEKQGGAEKWSVQASQSRDMSGATVIEAEGGPETVLSLPAGDYYWTVVARNGFGMTEAANGPFRIRIQ